MRGLAYDSTARVIDSHCHLDSERFDADRDAVLERAWAAGLEAIVVPGVGPSDWQELLRWPAKEGRVQVGFGVHPQLLPEVPENSDDAMLEELDELLGRGVAIAVGECGLDGPSAERAPVERQVRVLRRHFELARKYQLPVLVHCLRLQPAMVEFLKSEPVPEAGALMHSYSGGADLVKFYAAKGCAFSFAGPVTYADARKPLDAVRAVPADRLMAETDAPDQSPHPHRGTRSEPAYLPLIIDAMAKALGVSAEELARRTSENARRFFRLR